MAQPALHACDKLCSGNIDDDQIAAAKAVVVTDCMDLQRITSALVVQVKPAARQGVEHRGGGSAECG